MIKEKLEAATARTCDRHITCSTAALLAQPLVVDALRHGATIADIEERGRFVADTFDSVATVCVALAKAIVHKYDLGTDDDGADTDTDTDADE